MKNILQIIFSELRYLHNGDLHLNIINVHCILIAIFFLLFRMEFLTFNF